MELIEKKTTILLTPRLHKKLSRLSRTTRKSIGLLLREAAEKQYFDTSSFEQASIIKQMAAMNVPAGSPEEIEQEILRGRLDS